MKKEQDYFQDLTEIRSMMERSSKFLSLSGWAGIMAGIYALAGAYVAYYVVGFDLGESSRNVPSTTLPDKFLQVILVGLIILVLAIGTAIVLSYRNASRKRERIWNATSKRLVVNMAVPLVAGGVLLLILISQGFIGLVAPLSLVFYGISLYNASNFTFEVLKFLGIILIILGLMGVYFMEYGLLFWAVGFGAFHIIYGIYMHIRYER